MVVPCNQKAGAVVSGVSGVTSSLDTENILEYVGVAQTQHKFNK